MSDESIKDQLIKELKLQLKLQHEEAQVKQDLIDRISLDLAFLKGEVK